MTTTTTDYNTFTFVPATGTEVMVDLAGEIEIRSNSAFSKRDMITSYGVYRNDNAGEWEIFDEDGGKVADGIKWEDVPMALRSAETAWGEAEDRRANDFVE